MATMGGPSGPSPRLAVTTESQLDDIIKRRGLKHGPPKTRTSAARDGNPEPIKEGRRNIHLTSYAGSMRRRGMGESAIRAALREENRDCEPPLEDAEVRAIARSVSGYVPAEHPEEAEHLTDLGNARRFVRAHKDNVRFCHPWRRWLAWTGTHWEIDETGALLRRAKDVVRSLYREAEACEDKDRRQAVGRHAWRSESEGKLTAMLALAESEPGIPVLPDDLDRDPWLLNVVNGTVDLRTGHMREHHRGDYVTKRIPVPYTPEATCPTWHAFLHRIFDGKESLIAFLRRAVGYSLTGDTSEQCIFICHGKGENGKSTQIQTLLGLMADYARKTPTDSLMARRGESIPNDIARLKGARFVAAVEAGEGRRFAESLVKELTGGDTIAARFMRAEWFEFLPQFKIWLATNHKPRIYGTDRAIWRRIRLIPYTVTIPKTEQDRQLAAKLRKEWPGILAWAINGCQEWQRLGLDEPEEVVAATEEYRAGEDVIGGFLDECCVLEPSATTVAKDLYQAYETWARNDGEHAVRKTDFWNCLAERDLKRGRTKNARFWEGLRLVMTNDI